MIGGNPISHKVFPDGKVSSLYRISFETLYNLPKGYGGRIGVLPKLPDGSYLINLSNRGLWGDFGGGVKAKEYHLHALERELDEEVPMWTDTIFSRIVRSRIYALEEFYPYDKQKTRRTIRVQVICIVDFPEEEISKFSPSEEVLEIKRVIHLKSFLQANPLNLGLQQLLLLDDPY
jgi:hypothetical protein